MQNTKLSMKLIFFTEKSWKKWFWGYFPSSIVAKFALKKIVGSFLFKQFFLLTFFPYFVYFGGKIDFLIYINTFLINKWKDIAPMKD